MVEGGIIFASVLASFSILREGSAGGVVSIEDAVVRGIVVAFFCQVCMYLLDLYDLRMTQSRGELFFSLLFAVGFVCVGIGVVSYVFPEFGVEGRMYYLTIFFVAVFLLVWRVVFNKFLSQESFRTNILVVGVDGAARMVAKEMQERGRLGFRVVGFIGAPGSDDGMVRGLGKILGDYGCLKEIVKKQSIRKIVVAINERRGEYPVQEMLDLKVDGCQVIEWPEFFEKMAGRIPIQNLSPSYFIFGEGFRKSQFILLSRRIFSLLFATTALVLLSPILLATAILIKIDSSGPVIYSQTRVGQKGKEFRIYKFRSMKDQAEGADGARWAQKDDQRVTRVGWYLRKMRIDELPQLFNLIRGDLDLMGPRPERPEFVKDLQKTIPYYSLRHTVKPGLTGWAQVMFTYCGTIEESREKLQYDLFYIKNMSLKLDLLILFQTVKIVLLGRGAR